MAYNQRTLVAHIPKKAQYIESICLCKCISIEHTDLNRTHKLLKRLLYMLFCYLLLHALCVPVCACVCLCMHSTADGDGNPFGDYKQAEDA